MTEKNLDTKEWFVRATPNPTLKNVKVQLGCVLEEMGEFCYAINNHLEGIYLKKAGGLYKSGQTTININHQEMRDAAQDIFVTLVGLYHMLGLDWDADCKAVNESNWSKFVDGQPIFDKNGKIAKGPDYKPPVFKNI